MNENQKFWIQIIAQSFLPIVLGGSGILFLTEVKEQLPAGLYDIFIYVIVLFFVMILVRLAFSDLIWRVNNWLSSKITYKRNLRIAVDWVERFEKIYDLVWDIETTEEFKDKQTQVYSEQRVWFMLHRTRVLPLWHSFERARNVPAYERDYLLKTAHEKVFSENYDDPFSCFYEPLTLSFLKHKLEQSRIKDELHFVLSKLLDRSNEFLSWMKYRE